MLDVEFYRLYNGINQSINQSIYSVAGSKPMHSNTLEYNTIKNNKVKKEYSANVLELVKERTSPMPTQR